MPTPILLAEPSRPMAIILIDNDMNSQKVRDWSNAITNLLKTASKK